MNDSDSDIVDAAIAWQQAVARDGDGMDWPAFTGWLEADPRHRAAFDEIASIDAAVADHRAVIREMLDHNVSEGEREVAAEASRHGHRRWFLGTGIAAALALAIGVPLMLDHTPDNTDYKTGPGTTRNVVLTDGTTIALSADSTVTVTPGRHRIAMARGAAYFDVPHDPGRRLLITARGYRISDIGTQFSVDLTSNGVSVAVAEGNVSVTPPTGDVVRVRSGQRLTATLGAPPSVVPIAPAAVASWRKGRLTYDDAPLDGVAADISRYTGERIDVGGGLDGRRFSGVLVIGDGSHLVSDLAAVAGLVVERDGARVILRAKTG